MICRFERSSRDEQNDIAGLTTDLRVRVLNCGPSGCLVETTRALPVGSVARLRITFSGGDFEDTVQVVRCQEITGAGAVYHVGTEFLTTTPPSVESLRYLIRRETGQLGGWLLTQATG
jgi:hypothetical protein